MNKHAMPSSFKSNLIKPTSYGSTSNSSPSPSLSLQSTEQAKEFSSNAETTNSTITSNNSPNILKVHALFVDLAYALGIYGINSSRLEMHINRLRKALPFIEVHFRYTPTSIWICFTPKPIEENIQPTVNLQKEEEQLKDEGYIEKLYNYHHVTRNSYNNLLTDSNHDSFLRKSKFYFIKLDEYDDLEDMDLVKLCELDQLAFNFPQQLAISGMDELNEMIDDLRERIRSIISNYSFFRASVSIMIANIISAGCWTLYYDGSYIEMFCGFIVGIWMGILSAISEKYPSFLRVLPFMSAVVAGLVASLLKLFFSHVMSNELRQKYPFSVFLITLCSLFNLLPGVSFTSGISASKNLVSGAVRIFFGFMTILQMGFGILVADKISYLFNMSLTKNDDYFLQGDKDREDLPLWIGCSFLPFILIGNYFDYKIPLVFRNPYFEGYHFLSKPSFLTRTVRAFKNIHWTTLIANIVVSYAVYIITTIADDLFGEEMSALLGAFVAGAIGNAYSYFTNKPELLVSICGLDYLVPSTYGAVGIAKFYSRGSEGTDELKSGISFIADLLVIHLSMSIGLLLADLCVPSRKERE
ncbi:hypothetical protein ABK040_013364 [Willaertia magna]